MEESFAPLGPVLFPHVIPTACAVGCTLPPLRGWMHIDTMGGSDRMQTAVKTRSLPGGCGWSGACGDNRKRLSPRAG